MIENYIDLQDYIADLEKTKENFFNIEPEQR